MCVGGHQQSEEMQLDDEGQPRKGQEKNSTFPLPHVKKEDVGPSAQMDDNSP